MPTQEKLGAQNACDRQTSLAVMLRAHVASTEHEFALMKAPLLQSLQKSIGASFDEEQLELRLVRLRLALAYAKWPDAWPDMKCCGIGTW